ncbi:MAG: CPBP family intramembrane metalloprotease [Alteromonadaceae bacterium]|nr:CPBP family intramembrane metalloprotease [Alteromonadaceae bacterium]|tara:strand:- start:4312 stop:5226 length:915 start_codon:yes stop_codon:yes gene_type:complete
MYFHYHCLCYLGIKRTNNQLMTLPDYHLLAALFYSALLLLCTGSTKPAIRFGIPAVAVWLSLNFAGSLLFAAQATAYIGLTYLLQQQRLSGRWSKIIAWGLWSVLSVGLLTHLLPGYQGLPLTVNGQIKANSLAASVYLNTDKVLIAWALLQWIPVWQKNSQISRPAPGWYSLVLSLLAIPLIMLLAVELGLLQWQPGLSGLLAIIILSNLLNTCFTEELLFRGGLQNYLQQKAGIIGGLMIVSGLFGLAHFAGGGWYMLLATLAGLLYGLVYLLTGRLLWAVLCHWGLNTTHLLLFTWPVVQV